ncbi:hypothetical protein [Pseudomonas abyssi]|uniref:hypothetical protein n=1 Tax=Pseudomonas abyssi TaxID=170540 RepID=UPI003CCC2A43
MQLDQHRLDSLRAEMAAALFAGNTAFGVDNVLATRCSVGWRGGPAPDWDGQPLRAHQSLAAGVTTPQCKRCYARCPWRGRAVRLHV